MKIKHLLILVLAAILLYFFCIRGHLIKKKIRLAEQDMVQVSEAIEGWCRDWGLYPVPDEVFIPGSVYSQRYAAGTTFPSIDPEAIELLNRLPKSKRQEYLKSSGRQTSQFTASELKVCFEIEEIIDPDGTRSKWGRYHELERSRLYYYESSLQSLQDRR